MTEKIKTIYEQLADKMPQEAIQRTIGTETKKGYDTDGYGYQFCVDRFNSVLGLEGWGFDWEIIKEMEGAFKSGQPFFAVDIKMAIWVVSRENKRVCVGGHMSSSFADALKGAITNGFKKTASFWGVGRDAYAGTIDDDNKPLPDSHENIVSNSPNIKQLQDHTYRPVNTTDKCSEKQVEYIEKMLKFWLDGSMKKEILSMQKVADTKDILKCNASSVIKHLETLIAKAKTAEQQVNRKMMAEQIAKQKPELDEVNLQ